MRKRSFTDAYETYFTLGRDLNQRDTIAVKKMVSGLIKIIYPDGNFDKEQLREILEIALESRMISFWNAIEGGKSVEEATKESVKAWSDAFKDPLLFAPYKVGDRIGQMVVIPYPNVKLREKEQLSETERADGAFGSTDKKE